MAPFLCADPALAHVALEPPADDRLVPDGSAEGARAAHAWNANGGLLQALSAHVGVDVAAAVAVLCVESGGSAYGADGRMIIRFENHIFRREWSGGDFDRYFRCDAAQPWTDHAFRRAPGEPWMQFHGVQAMEWRVFEFARGLDERAAMRSISMGAPQIMGFNHAGIGYPRVQDMFERFQSDARYQVIGLFDFLAGGGTDSRMLRALRDGDYPGFATSYNGPGQAAVYGELIAKHVEAFTRVRGPSSSRPDAPATAPAADGATAVVADGADGAADPGRAEGAASVAAPRTGGTERPAREYVVRAGDSLGAIASRYGVSVEALARANGIANPDLVRAGQALRVPAAPAPPPSPVPAGHRPPDDLDELPPAAVGETYTVLPGDTLGAIAARCGAPLDAIVRLNGIANPDAIRVGQVLRLPD